MSDRFPGFAYFYRFSESFGSHPYRGDPVGYTTQEIWQISMGRLQPATPVVVKHEMGAGIPRDIAVTTTHMMFISQRLLDLFNEAGFRGYQTTPAVLYTKRREAMTGYHVFIITGKCGLLDYSRSERVMRPVRPGSTRLVENVIGARFDPATWDGSDFFYTAYNMERYVTEPVVALLKRHRIRDVETARLTEMEILSSIIEAGQRTVAAVQTEDAKRARHGTP